MGVKCKVFHLSAYHRGGLLTALDRLTRSTARVNIYTTNVHLRACLYECENMASHALSCCSDRQGLITTSFHWSIIMERTRCIMWSSLFEKQNTVKIVHGRLWGIPAIDIRVMLWIIYFVLLFITDLDIRREPSMNFSWLKVHCWSSVIWLLLIH